MKAILATAPILIALPLLIFAAIWQGRQTLRWGDFVELDEFAARLKNVPYEAGSWKGEIGPPLKADEIAQAGIKGYANVNFTNTETGDRVGMFIVCARLVDVSNHTPDRCYPANGYQSDHADPSQQSVELPSGGKADFKMADFELPDKSGYTRIYWTWTTDGSWRAPHEPREIFVRTQPIYKLYIEERPLKKIGSPGSEGPPVDLIKSLIPESTKKLFPDAAPASAPATDDGGAKSKAKAAA